MWNTADMAEHVRDAHEYGFSIPGGVPSFDWSTLKKKRDAYIKRLNGIYERNLEKDKCDYLAGTATFLEPGKVEVKFLDGSETKVLTAKHICVAAGGHPTFPDGIPGAEYGIDSDGFFRLEKQPKRVAIVGAGYIAIEFAGIFNALGTETNLFIRYSSFLRTFDPMIQDVLLKEYEEVGIKIHKNSKPFSKVEKLDSGALRIHYESDLGEGTVEVDTLIWAIGRSPETDALRLHEIGVKTDKKGQIVVDQYQNSTVEGIYALGDVTGQVELTPGFYPLGFTLILVAIAAGRRLADRLFGGSKFSTSRLDYTNIPSVVFAHPEIGTIGLTEPQARKQYGDENIKIYKSEFIAMYFAMLDKKGPTAYKLVCEGPNGMLTSRRLTNFEERIVGMHIIGVGSAEILQGFGVAIKMGATKANFGICTLNSKLIVDSCVAIHPTSAEELVTMR
jgi:glutathione reductase (NADPH)